MVLFQLLDFCKKELQQANISSYKIDAEVMICYCLDISKEKLIFSSKMPLDEIQINKAKELIQRRCNREPVSHIIGKRGFYEDDFIVNANVLDPRPDSEILIETIYKNFKNTSSALKILELGIGSGCLILSVLKKFPNATGLGVDINPKSIEIANLNARNLKLDHRISLKYSNWYDGLNTDRFDIIISNPPYIKTSQIDSLQDEVRLFEPRIALDGGQEGLDCYIIIAKDIKNYLNDDGYIFLEIGQGQESEVIKIFSQKKLKFIESQKDLGGIIRCLVFKNG
jgi:release factor glutamine methyltransferase